MLVGGSPMGTAGGVKTTTLAVLVLSIIANLGEKRCRGLWEKDSQQLYPFCTGSCGNGG